MVILAGAPLAGPAPRVADRVAVPLVDPIAAAVKQVRGGGVARAPQGACGRLRPPRAEALDGLAPALAARIAGER
nr:hypothetical protein [Elioraea tepida]